MWRESAHWLWIFLAGSVGICDAGDLIPVQALDVKGVYGTRPGDPTIYCLLGLGTCEVATDPGSADAFIGHWLADHRRAVAIPISAEIHRPWLRGTVTAREVFIWVEDGPDSLTLSLVRQGFYPASALRDMVSWAQEAEKTRERLSAVTATPIDKLAPAIPLANRPRRLISDTDYTDRMRQASAAEADAKRLQRGIWSDPSPHDDHARTAAELSVQVFPVADLYVSGTHGHRLGDPDVYCLLGGSACELWFPMTSFAPGEIEFVQKWLTSHPDAQAVPISATNYLRLVKGPLVHSTYIWIEDRGESLNIELVRNGFWWANSLQDMVAYDQQLMSQVRDSPLPAADDELLKEREKTGEPKRLISEDEYAARMASAVAAEHEAERNRRGLWSDARITLWRPPSDERLIEQYRRQKTSFSRIAALIAKDERLIAINWDPKSWAAAASAGASRDDIKAYAGLLRKLGVNHELTGVVELGKFCLITNDITYGITDTGVIKGYVFAPTDPQPLVDDLENHGRLDGNAITAYRKIDQDWYLFELVH